MKRTVRIEGDATRLTLSNLGSVEGIDAIDLDGSDINDAEDIREVMETIESYAQSGELDATTDIQTYTLAVPDGLRIDVCDEEGERKATLEYFELRNHPFEPVSRLLEQAKPGDIVYLRRESGKGEWEGTIESEAKAPMQLDYFDCSVFDLGRYELLNEPYFHYLCDTIVPESLRQNDTRVQITHRLFEPRVVYGELYRVVEDGETWDRYLERIEIPGYYFLSEENLDEI